MALLSLWCQPCFLWADSLCPFLTGPRASGLVVMCQYKVMELLNSSVLVVEPGLFLLNSHRVLCSQTPTPTTMLQVMNGFCSHYAEENMEAQGCGAISYPSHASAAPPPPLEHSAHPGPILST